MKKIMRMALATSTLLLTASAYAAPTEALRICADPGNMPLSNTSREGFQNKIADVIAEAMGRHTTYFYRPYLERGLTRQTFKNNSCDVLMGMSPEAERMITSTPVYRTTFVLASRADRNYDFKDLDDPRLKELTVGVFQHSATRTELMEHAVNGPNVKLHIISHDADLHP
jgi:ABC-type amino acid transport substrate-binding protein